MIRLVKFLDILKSKGAKNPTQNSNSTTSNKPQESLSEGDYVKRCLGVQFMEGKEDRTFRSNSAFSSVLTPLNSREYSKAIMAGKQILPQFADFDLLYKWVGDAYRATKNYDESKAILNEGLLKAKRKILLLTSMGETEIGLGNIEDAVFWWCQAYHCLSKNPIDYNAYLLLSYVAKGVGDSDSEQRLLNRVDTLRGGRIRLDSQTARNMLALVSKGNKEAMKKVLQGLHLRRSNDLTMERAVFEIMYNGSVAEGNAFISRYIKSGKNVNAKNYKNASILNVAARMGLDEAVRQLINAKADLNSIDNEGTTALMGSIGNGYVEIAKLLIKSGTDVNVGRDNHFGWTPLIMVMRKKEPNPELIHLLLKTKADLSVKDKEGQTALDYAKKSGRKDLIDLLSNQIDANSKKDQKEQASQQSNEPAKEENNMLEKEQKQVQEKKELEVLETLTSRSTNSKY